MRVSDADLVLTLVHMCYNYLKTGSFSNRNETLMEHIVISLNVCDG